MELESEDLVTRALAEDVGARDLTTEAVIEPGTRARAVIRQKQPGVLYGYEVAEAVFRRLDATVEWQPLVPEAQWRNDVPAEVVRLEGDARALLTAERVALNFLQRLSGVATVTARCVHELRGTGVQVLDTRKTTPGLRLLEKRAVAAGGGRNHRMGLYDAVLVKDNHAVLAGGVGEATRRALRMAPAGTAVEVECSTVEDVEEALAAGAQRLLLDNMDPGLLREVARRVGGRAELEASGSIRPGSVREVGGTGVQWISIGSLTHSAPALDLSMTVQTL